MTSFKHNFPNEESLRRTIVDGWGDLTERVQYEVRHIEERHRKWRRIGRNSLWAALVFVLWFIFAPIFGAHFLPLLFFSSLANIVLIPVGILAVIILLIKLHFVGALFSKAVNKVLFPEILSWFEIDGEFSNGLFKKASVKEEGFDKRSSFVSFFLKLFGGAYGVDKAFKEKTLKLLDSSELITESRNTVHVDDQISAKVFNKEVIFSELDVSHVTGSGKRRRRKMIFKGIFVSFEMSRSVEGKTFVSSEGDKNGFGHLSFWSGLSEEGVQETELEWGQFEDKLHVAATDPVEARYILTPDLMEDVYDWWSFEKKNIRMSFIGNRFYILFPHSKVALGKSVREATTEQLQEYALDVALPIMHTLHIVEDIENRFRS